MRILSGMQPSGQPHIGNYLGAMRQHVALAHDPANECYYCIVDYHALTTVRDPEKLREYTKDLALDYLALGLDPKKATFFRQSDVPAHLELTWILSTLTSMGLLERAHAWKDAKTKKKKEPSVGLFTYPILMASDILLYRPDRVPVGKDQKQHVEMCRDMAEKFNNTYGETLTLPEPDIREEVAVIPGIDGQKMSKSYGNIIPIFASEKEIKKQVMAIVTDSKGVDEPKDPESSIICQLYRFFAPKKEGETMEKSFTDGGLGYGDAKKRLYEAIMDHFGPARKKRIELEKDLGYLEEVLRNGAVKANRTAEETMEKVRARVGLK